MCLVQRIVDDEVHDRYCENVGIITLEDIIEEILQDEIEDEMDRERGDKKGGRKGHREKLVELFQETRGENSLSAMEKEAVLAFLTHSVGPFRVQYLKPELVKRRIDTSEVVTINSDATPVSHVIQEQRDFNPA